MDYYDIVVQNPELKQKMQQLGWNTEIFEAERNFITSEDWGEVKQQATQKDRINILKSPDPELALKAVKLDQLDAVMSPEKDRKDAGMNHVIAKAAAKNDTAVILSFNDLTGSRKKRMHTLSHWRTVIKLAEKYEFDLILSTGAESEEELRNPRDLEAFMKTLDVKPAHRPLKQNPSELLEGYV